MPRTRSQSQSVSLFPFLAVLVCAMGALILLLIVTTRRIRKEALVKAAVKVEKPKPPPAPPVALTVPPLPSAPVEEPVKPTVPALPEIPKATDETDRIMATHAAKIRKLDAERKAMLLRLQSQRDGEKKKLAALKIAITKAQSELTKARQLLRNIEANAARYAGNLKDDRATAAKFKQQAIDLAGRIAALRSEIVKLKQQEAETSSRFAIVPFDGNRGTTRRPIYIECTKTGLRILPEDITIGASDLQHFTAEYNPLLAGTQALLHFWEAHAKATGNPNEPAPYVLLLVRPGGTMAYYVARKMLRTLPGPAGYELIENDWKLAMPTADPKAKAVCRLAVDRALAARNETIRSLAGNRPGVGTGSSSGRNMRFNRSTGRFEVIRPDKHVTGGSKPFRTEFGRLLNDNDQGKGVVRRPAGGGSGSGAQIKPLVKDFKPGTGTGRKGNGRGSNPNRKQTGNQAGPSIVSQQQSGHSNNQKTTGNAVGNPIQPRRRTNHPLWPLTGDRKTPAPKPGGRQGSTTGDPGEQWQPTRSDSSKRKVVSGSPSGRYVGSPTPGGGAGPNNVNGHSKATVGGGDGRGTAHKSGGGGTGGFRKIRWGLSDPNASIGFEKDVRIWCTADRIVIGSRQVIKVDKSTTRDKLLRSIVFAVEAEARSWGKPPKGFFWVPSPEFVISPGGNQHYERINGGLKKLGLESSAQYRLDTTPPTWVKGGTYGP